MLALGLVELNAWERKEREFACGSTFLVSCLGSGHNLMLREYSLADASLHPPYLRSLLRPSWPSAWPHLLQRGDPTLVYTTSHCSVQEGPQSLMYMRILAKTTAACGVQTRGVWGYIQCSEFQ